MKVYILASGRTRPEYWGKIETHKSLLVLGQTSNGTDITILDLQMRKYRKFQLDPVFILGYKREEIMQHYRERWGSITFLLDKSWDGEYTLLRMLKEVEKPMSLIPEPFLMIHGDLIFDDNLLKYLTKCTSDVCRANDENMAFKFTPHGFSEMMKVIHEEPHLTGLNSDLWRKLEGKVTFGQSPLIWQYDVDNPVEYIRAKAIARSRI